KPETKDDQTKPTNEKTNYALENPRRHCDRVYDRRLLNHGFQRQFDSAKGNASNPGWLLVQDGNDAETATAPGPAATQRGFSGEISGELVLRLPDSDKGPHPDWQTSSIQCL